MPELEPKTIVEGEEPVTEPTEPKAEPVEPGKAAEGDKPADPPEVKEKSAEYYQAKAQEETELRKEVEAERDESNAKLEQFVNFQTPTTSDAEDLKIDPDDEEVEDRIAKKSANMVLSQIRKDKQQDNEAYLKREYQKEQTAVDSQISNYAKKYDIPKDVIETAKAESLRFIPKDYNIGDASRRCELVLRELGNYAVTKGKLKAKVIEDDDDAKKRADLKTVSQPAGGGTVPVVEQEKTAEQREAESIAPPDNFPLE